MIPLKKPSYWVAYLPDDVSQSDILSKQKQRDDRAQTVNLVALRRKVRLKKSRLKATGLSVLGLTVVALATIGCQPTPKDTIQDDAVASSAQQAQLESSMNINGDKDEGRIPSPAAQATIDKFEAEFVAKRLSLQQSQLAEYEALQAADASNTTVTTVDLASPIPDSTVSTPALQNRDSNSGLVSGLQNEDTSTSLQNKSTATADNANDTTENTNIDTTEDSTKVENVTLVNLPLVETAIQPPETLTAVEIASRYQVAMQSLYLPEDLPMPAKAVDTLLNIATLTPEIFNQPQLANRLVVKMPALARLLKQYQTWEQIEAQQSAELQALKEAQAQEFDQLIAEFDETIKGYDEQIAKYEKKLEEFE